MAIRTAPSPARRAPGSSDASLDSGDDLTELVNPHLPRLFDCARAILGSDDRAWDAVQETLLRIWRKGWLPPDPGRVLAHLVVRSSLHQLRCDRRRRAHESRADAQLDRCCPEDPLGALEREERALLVRRALRFLSSEHRAVVELFAFDGESYERISERLGLPVGTVRSRLSRARTALRERLVEEDGRVPRRSAG